MRPFDAKQVTTRARQKAGPSEELRIAVTFRGARDQVGLTKVAARLSSASVSDMAPDSLGVDQALHELGRRGFEITRRGRMAVSIRGSRQLFERTFGTRLQRVDL